MFEDVVTMVAARPGWSVAGEEATFAWLGTAWIVRVRAAKVMLRSHQRFHVVTVNPAGVPERTHWAGTVAEAVRLAEAAVRGRLAIEAAQR